MVSGFLDRAEKIFEQLIDEPEHRESALQQLTAIYQQTREWHKAIECATALVKLGRKRMKVNIAHFYCELAMLEKADSNDNKAIQLFKKHYKKIRNVYVQPFHSVNSTYKTKTIRRLLII